MTEQQLNELAWDTAGFLVNWGKTINHPDWKKPTEQMADVVRAALQSVAKETEMDAIVDIVDRLDARETAYRANGQHIKANAIERFAKDIRPIARAASLSVQE